MSNRWFIAFAAILAHLCLGSVYAWSVFVAPIAELTGWRQPQITWAFSTAICCLGLTAAFGAKLMQRMGPRRSVLLAGFLFSGGLAGAALACHVQSLALLYLLFGVVGGIGLGMGYAPPVATLLKWFPDRKGLATGLAVCGFGLGALVASQLAERFLPRIGCVGTFLVMAGLYLPLILIAALILRQPPEQAPITASAGPSDKSTVSASLRTTKFWLIWGVFYVNIAAGIMLIALAKPMAKADPTLSAAMAAAVVPAMAIFNAGGRLGWSAVSDTLGRSRTFLTMLLLQVCIFAFLPNAHGLAFVAMLLLTLSCYGGGFALTPAFIADLFGTKNTAALYGVALTAWSAAAFSGPPLGAYLKEVTGHYTAPLYTAAVMLFLGLLMTIALHLTQRKAAPAPTPQLAPVPQE